MSKIKNPAFRGSVTIYSRPLTPYMEELLMDVHERQLLDIEPYEVGTTKFCKGLIKRNLLEIKGYTTAKGKKIFALFVTAIGYDYLNNL